MDPLSILQAGARGLESQGWRFQVISSDLTLYASVGLGDRFYPVHLSAATPWVEVYSLAWPDTSRTDRFDPFLWIAEMQPYVPFGAFRLFGDGTDRQSGIRHAVQWLATPHQVELCLLPTFLLSASLLHQQTEAFLGARDAELDLQAHFRATVEAMHSSLMPEGLESLRSSAIDGYRFGQSMDWFASQFDVDDPPPDQTRR